MNPKGNYYLMYNPVSNRYYVCEEGWAGRDVNDAKLFTSLEEIITTTTIMKDWNWDYLIFKHDENGLKEIPFEVWHPVYAKWKMEKPEEYNSLYS